jgi:hypothetical protein
VAGAATLAVAVPAVATPQTFQLSPGQRQCVTLRVAAVPGDQLYTQVNHQGNASAPVQWTRWGDTVDGTDGFGNATLAEQSVTDRTAQNFGEQVGETDDGSFQRDVWFCAKNRGTTTVSATLEITTVQYAAPTWILTRTGNTSYWAHGALLPGQQACTGAGARHATIEAYLGLRLASVTIANSVTTRAATNNQYAQLSIDSAQPGGFPDGITGCVRNIDTAQLNFQFYFYWG